MKVLVIGDVHGRKFWRKAVADNIGKVDKVIFLGDYLDPYPGESTPEKSIEVFKEILEFKNKNSNLVTLLLGNHDLPYYSIEYAKSLSYLCRHDYKNREEIVDIFETNEKNFQIAWQCENSKLGKVLFTHAGVTNTFKEICGLDSEQINNFFFNENTSNIPNIVGLATVSWYRGGYNISGSPVWADVREHINYPVTEVFQIFGHTYSKEAIILENFAMLDDGKSCYILDENGIKKL